MDHERASGLFQVLTDQQYLMDAAFLPPILRSDNDFENEVFYEDEAAAVAVKVVAGLAQQHLRLWMFGFPHRFVILLDDAQQSAELFASSREQLRIFRQLEAMGTHCSPIVAKIRGRRHFQKLCVQQLVLACEELGFERSDLLMAILMERFSTIMSSSVVEHLNNWQKNSRICTGCGGRYRRPQTSMAATIHVATVSTLHRYKAVPQTLVA